MIWAAIPFFSSLSSFFLLQHTLWLIKSSFSSRSLCILQTACEQKRSSSRSERLKLQLQATLSLSSFLPSSALILFSHPSLLKPGPPSLSSFPSESFSSSKPPTAELICSWTSDWMPGCRGDGVSSFKSWLEPNGAQNKFHPSAWTVESRSIWILQMLLKINLEGKITNKISLIAQLFLLYGNEIK